MRLAKKNIFSLFFLFHTSFLYGSNITETFKVERNNSNQTFVSMKANAHANKLIFNNAYLAIINNDEYQDCWLEFSKNKKIEINVSEAKLNPVSANKDFIFYELVFSSIKIDVPENIKQKFKSFCIK